MTTDGCARVMDRLRTLFPSMAGNVEQQAKMGREMLTLGETHLMRAIDEYKTLGEKFLNPSQLMAIAYRLARQEQERADAAAKATGRLAELERKRSYKASFEHADALIAEMTDDEVRHEWEPILAMFTGKPREWAAAWPISKVRTNNQLRLRVAALVGAK